MIKAIIFDLGGVLMTDVPLKQIAEELSEKSSLSAEEIHAHLYPTEHWNLLTLGKITEDEYWDNFLNLPNVDLDREYLKQKVRSSLYPRRHSASMINLLKGNYRLAILSNHAKEWSEYMKQKFDLLQVFDPIIFSCDVGLRKPDPRIYEITLGKLKCDAQECIFIDDKKRNTDAAEKLGMKGIVFREFSKLLEDLRSSGVKIELTDSSDAIASGT